MAAVLHEQMCNTAGIIQLTETYSPAAIDKAPAIIPANAASTIALRVVSAAATPITILVVESMPSLAPSTTALSQPIRFT